VKQVKHTGMGAAIITALILTACGSATPTQAPASTAHKIKVIATFSVVSDFVQNVAGDQVELRPWWAWAALRMRRGCWMQI
jgi:ABC-type Zn uptake system ZnuABC Zn-binding protein ZnuA